MVQFMYAFDNGLHEIKPAGHGNISIDATKAETDASSKSAMTDKGENCGPAAPASSRILSHTRLPSCVTLQPRD